MTTRLQGSCAHGLAILPPLLQGKANLVSNTANLDSNTALFLLPAFGVTKGEAAEHEAELPVF